MSVILMTYKYYPPVAAFETLPPLTTIADHFYSVLVPLLLSLALLDYRSMEWLRMLEAAVAQPLANLADIVFGDDCVCAWY